MNKNKKSFEYHLRRKKNSKLKRNYGISLTDYDAMLTEQDFKCKICSEKHKKEKPLVVDHNHKSGIIRGLLCGLCNIGLGYFRDSPKRLRLAAKYLGVRKRTGSQSEPGLNLCVPVI